MNYAPWTDAMVEKLKDMRAEGVSYGVIAAELGVSRNAAIGKGQRIGIAVPRMFKPKQPRVRYFRRNYPPIIHKMVKPEPKEEPIDSVTEQIRSRDKSICGSERVIA